MRRSTAPLLLLVSACSANAGGNADQAQTWIGQPVWSLVKRYSLVKMERAPGPDGAEKLAYKMPQQSGLCDVYVTARAVDGDYVISEMTSTCPASAITRR